jgi:hypothetical protein
MFKKINTLVCLFYKKIQNIFWKSNLVFYLCFENGRKPSHL